MGSDRGQDGRADGEPVASVRPRRVAEHDAPDLFRVRVLLRATATVSLHAHHGAVVYALIAAAHADDDGEGAAVPDGLLLDAPEQCRVHLARGEPYAFGFTLLDDDPASASRRVATLVRGLERVGAARKPAAWGLRGNFEVVAVEDLVAAAPWTAAGPLRAVPADLLAREVDALAGRNLLTLRFLSPLRTRVRPEGAPADVRYADGRAFRADRFVSRVRHRLEDLAMLPPRDEDARRADVEVVENRLVWLDLPYGSPARRKVLGGAVGRLRLRVDGVEARRALVLGQHVRVGEGTRFGFGRYRIEELGPEPFPATRAVPLLDAIVRDDLVDRAAVRHDLPGGRLRAAAGELLAGRWTPGAPARVPLRTPGRRTRTLSIPPQTDRALQRVVHDGLAPALDRLFETSSFAYRRGLGRARAAQRIAEAYARGYRFAVKSDFRRFFDTVDHRVLRDRLEAYLGDDAATAALFAWVERAGPAPGLGLPTGSPLSPLLANVLLDAFDEEVARDGGLLVRYADDFVVLVKSRDEADRLYAEARDAAESLRLVLNDEKSCVLDLTEPFEFLGFRFRREGTWTARAVDGVRPLDALGWEDAPAATPVEGRIRLPGEGEAAVPVPRAVAIVPPDVVSLSVSEGALVGTRADGEPAATVALDRVREVVVLGRPTIAGSALRALVERDVPLHVADGGGRSGASLLAAGTLENPEVVAAQVDAARDPVRTLAIARRLVERKLEGYAALAQATSPDGRAATATALRDLRDRAREADALPSLRGVEGAAGAVWYARLPARLAPGHRFERRVAPSARDPVNILLNLGQMALHRLATSAVRAAGLLPSIGFLHAARSGHAALASDLQEPFRALVDRVVIEGSHEIAPADFGADDDGPHATRIRPLASRRFFERFHRTLGVAWAPRPGVEARPWVDWLFDAARSLRESLVDPKRSFDPFGGA